MWSEPIQKPEESEPFVKSEGSELLRSSWRSDALQKLGGGPHPVYNFSFPASFFHNLRLAFFIAK
jgi:hypothetical protein